MRVSKSTSLQFQPFLQSKVLMFCETTKRAIAIVNFEQLESPPVQSYISTSTSTNFDSSRVADEFDKLVLQLLAATVWWLILNHNDYKAQWQTLNQHVSTSCFVGLDFGFRVCRDKYIKITCGWRACLQFLHDTALSIGRAG